MEGVLYDGKGNLLGIINDPIADIVEYYGADNQKRKAVEEVVELTEVLIKDINKHSISVNDLYQEMADVLVMLTQLKFIYKLDGDMLDEIVGWKLQRQRTRMRTDCAWK